MRRDALCVLAANFLLLTVAACAPRPSPIAAPPGSPWFELVGEFNIPPLTTFAPLKSARFGGVSGIVFDPTPGPTQNDLLGICDDRDASRLFIFRMHGHGSAFRVELRAYFPLPPGHDSPDALDAEGIAMTRSGRIYVASEGRTREPRSPPSITIYNRRVEYLGRLAVPERFMAPEVGPATRGVRDNGGFEGLTITPDERHLFTAAELPLVQDGTPPSSERGALTRILEYEVDGDSYRPVREYAYPLDRAVQAGFTPRVVINGAVELIALNEKTLLVMERSFAQETGGEERSLTRIRIYRASLEEATDVSGVASLEGRPDVRPARKTLLLDLADVKGLSAELAQLDNFEGMAFGPDLPDGSRTLLLVSDDNFSTRQRTAFLLFRIVRPLLEQP